MVTAGWLTIRAFRRSNRSGLLLRITASLLATAAFSLIAIGPTYKSASSAQQNTAILITEFPSSEDPSADTLIQLIKDGTPAFTTDRAMVSFKNQEISFISDLSELNAGTLHLFGEGYNQRITSRLKTQIAGSIIYHKPINPDGFTAISWQPKINGGEDFLVQGQYQNKSDSKIKLLLQGFGTHLDSAEVAPGKISRFNLRTIPRNKGKAVFTITISSDGRILKEEKIPFQVMDAAPLKILLLSSSPDFENKFLKNWLFTNHYGIATRSRISKGKFNTELSNLEVAKPKSLTTSYISEFDLVIADMSELAAIAGSEQSALWGSVANGTGLVVRVDTIVTSSRFYNKGVSVQKAGNSQKELISLKTNEGITLSPLTIERPIYLKADQRTIISDNNERSFVTSGIEISGKIVHTVIQNSYSWSLAGDSTGYRAYWSSIINEAARRNNSGNPVNVSPALPVVNQPLTLEIGSNDSIPPFVSIQNERISLTHDYIKPYIWSGNYWQEKNGWQQVLSGKDESAGSNWIYVYNQDEWKDLRIKQQVELSGRLLSADDGLQTETKLATVTVKNLITKIIFIIIFIICAAYIWTEE
ncbi:MAG: hypothetical protein ABW174_07730, partial [Flavitalea sp.]